jgi:hypothetical protein
MLTALFRQCCSSPKGDIARYTASDLAFVAARNITYVPAVLVDGDPILLERPPKSMRSV